MQNALASGFNKQGRSLSEAMRIKYLTALAATQRPEFKFFEYRGFKVEGGSGKYFIDGMSHTITTSVQKSKDAIDRLIEIRAELAEDLA